MTIKEAWLYLASRYEQNGTQGICHELNTLSYASKITIDQYLTMHDQLSNYARKHQNTFDLSSFSTSRYWWPLRIEYSHNRAEVCKHLAEKTVEEPLINNSTT